MHSSSHSKQQTSICQVHSTYSTCCHCIARIFWIRHPSGIYNLPDLVLCAVLLLHIPPERCRFRGWTRRHLTVASGSRPAGGPAPGPSRGRSPRRPLSTEAKPTKPASPGHDQSRPSSEPAEEVASESPSDGLFSTGSAASGEGSTVAHLYATQLPQVIRSKSCAMKAKTVSSPEQTISSPFGKYVMDNIKWMVPFAYQHQGKEVAHTSSCMQKGCLLVTLMPF